MILFFARDRGYGPIAKAISIARLLPNEKKMFLGIGNTLNLAIQENVFDNVVNIQDADKSKIQETIKKCKYCISVMEQDLALLCYNNNVNYFFFDSLFGFWLSDNDIIVLDKTQKAKSTIKLTDYTSHEKKLIAHQKAKKSFIQNFYGVYERFNRLKIYLPNSFITTAQVSKFEKLKEKPETYKTLLFNLGGLVNSKSNIEKTYYSFIKSLLIKFLKDDSNYINQIIITSGYAEGYQNLIIKDNLRFCHLLFNNRDFQTAVRKSSIFISAPGLTTIMESITLNKQLFLMFEQHASHFYNISVLRKSPFKKCIISLSDYFPSIKNLNNPENYYLKILENKDLFNVIYHDFKFKLLQKTPVNFDFVRNELFRNAIPFQKAIKSIS